MLHKKFIVGIILFGFSYGFSMENQIDIPQYTPFEFQEKWNKFIDQDKNLEAFILYKQFVNEEDIRHTQIAQALLNNDFCKIAQAYQIEAKRLEASPVQTKDSRAALNENKIKAQLFNNFSNLNPSIQQKQKQDLAGSLLSILSKCDSAKSHCKRARSIYRLYETG